MNSGRFQFSISALLIVTVAASVAIFAWQALRPVTIIERLNNGRLDLEEDPRTRLGRDSSYSAELVQQLYPFNETESTHWSSLQFGVDLFRSGNQPKALSTWQSIATATPNSDIAIAALWNIGRAQHRSGELSNAILNYKESLSSSAESTSRHYIAIDLSHAYVQVGQITEAIKAAELSKTKYPPDSFCGLAYNSEQKCISKYILNLRSAISQNQSARLQTKQEWEAMRSGNQN